MFAILSKAHIPKLVFVTDIVRFSKAQLNEAKLQAEQQAQAQAQMPPQNEIVVRPGQLIHFENGVAIYGTAQTTSDPQHAALINQKASDLAASGDYDVITLDLSWRTATGRHATSGNRPDIIAIHHDGSILAIEIGSAGDTANTLYPRLYEGKGSFVTGYNQAVDTRAYYLNGNLLPPP